MRTIIEVEIDPLSDVLDVYEKRSDDMTDQLAEWYANNHSATETIRFIRLLSENFVSIHKVFQRDEYHIFKNLFRELQKMDLSDGTY